MKRLVAALVWRAMRSAPLCRALFGVELQALSAGDRYFDSATLALLQVLKAETPSAGRVLEIGTGSSALLARWMLRRGWEVEASEFDDATCERARAAVRAFAPGRLEVHAGAFFAEVLEPLDLLVFNPPFVPTASGTARGLSPTLRVQWDGGGDGSEVLSQFLAAFAARETEAIALVGIHTRHVSVELVERRIAEHGLRLLRWHTTRWSPARVARIARIAPH